MTQKSNNSSPTKKGNVTNKAPVKAAPSQSKNIMTSSKINRKDVETLAFKIATENKPYETYVWLFSEAQLRVQMGKQPNDNEIRGLSQQIFAQKRPVKDLHWGIAEMRLQFQDLQK